MILKMLKHALSNTIERVAINTEKYRKGPKRTERDRKGQKKTERNRKDTVKTLKRTEKIPKGTILIPKTLHAQTNIWEETIQVYFRVNRSVRCKLLGIGGVYLKHTTRTIRNNSVRASDILCYLIILSSQLPFINTSLIEQTKNMIVCYQNNIENIVCHNSGHATIAAPIGCSVVVDDRQLCGCITHTYPASMTN